MKIALISIALLALAFAGIAIKIWLKKMVNLPEPVQATIH
jgi:hypothetical protein